MGRHCPLGDRAELRKVDIRIRVEKPQDELVRSHIALAALVVLQVARRALLIESQVLRRLRNRNAEKTDKIGAIDGAFPKQPELDEFKPLTDTPAQSTLPNGYTKHSYLKIRYVYFI